MVQNAADYMAESYRRAISTPRYAYPFELFDMHLYPKAAWVLHMLRRQLGDDLFWKALRIYLRRHAPGGVETIDLVRSFEDATGKNLSRFFDQWIFSPGHPQLEGELTWDGTASWVKAAVKQTQKREDGTPVFHIPVRLEARLADGTIVERTFQMDQAEQTFYLPLPSGPVTVLVDPEGAVLREVKIKRPLEWIEAALLGPSREGRVFARVDLVRQLGEDAGPKATEILRKVVLGDPFWGVQAEAARALGKLRSPAARDALIEALIVEHPKARRAAVIALGLWRDETVARALGALVAAGDPSYLVQQSALGALGRSGGPAVAAQLHSQLHAALARRDWHDTAVQGAVEGLIAARDEEAVEELLALAADGSRYWLARVGALKGLGELGAARPRLAPRLAEAIVPFLEDPRVLVATRTPQALVTLGDQSAVAALRRRGQVSPIPEIREACLTAADDLAAQASRSEDVDRLRGELAKLRDETKELKESLEAVRSKVLPDPTPPKAPAVGKGKAKTGPDRTVKPQSTAAPVRAVKAAPTRAVKAAPTRSVRAGAARAVIPGAGPKRASARQGKKKPASQGGKRPAR
jgi:aminopeptidase N